MHFEQLVGTRGACVVLVDDAHGLRAAVTAFWLQQFNQCEVFVLQGEAPPWQAPDEGAAGDSASGAIEVQALGEGLAAGRAVVVDVGPSEDYERAHLPGARYLLPASLAPLSPLVAQGRVIVFTSPDGHAARIVANDARREWPHAAATLRWLEGGTGAWTREGWLTTSDYAPEDLLTPFDDDWGSTMRVGLQYRDAAWRQYLEWERALASRVARDPTVRFRLPGRSAVGESQL